MKLTSTQRIERTVLSLTMALKAAVYRQNDDSLMAVIAEKNQSNLMMPSEVRVVKEIPLLGSGKVDYQKLKSLV